jgi:hypothetical protein
MIDQLINHGSRRLVSWVVTFTLLSVVGGFAAEGDLADGQTVYVSIYSHIYSGLKGRPFDLAATLSIRNTDPKYPISITGVEFYDSEGNRVKQYLDAALTLRPLASTRYVLKEGEIGGGSGANFLVRWKADRPVNPPIIEGIMIGTRSGQGISFVCPGRVISEDEK